jgi:hypothetical protein
MLVATKGEAGVSSVLGNEGVVSEDAGALLGRIATTLERDGVDGAIHFGEMVRAAGALEPSDFAPNDAAASLMLEPITRGELTAASVLAALVKDIRQTALSDADLREVMTLAAVYASRFETYLAERDAIATR